MTDAEIRLECIKFASLVRDERLSLFEQALQIYHFVIAGSLPLQACTFGPGTGAKDRNVKVPSSWVGHVCGGPHTATSAQLGPDAA